jgi:uncharacterized membrane protein YeaQ/YmgE (transglycosylase-associated protein family)
VSLVTNARGLAMARPRNRFCPATEKPGGDAHPAIAHSHATGKEDAMPTQSLILFLVIGVLAGFLAGKIMKGGGFGVLGDLVIGVVGAFLGGWLFSLFGITAGGLLGALVTALVGALFLLYLIRLVKRA